MDCIPYINDLLTEIDILKSFSDTDEERIKKIQEKESLVEIIKSNLSKFSKNSIEYRIYFYYLSGMSISKAISKVADENYENDIKPFTERAIYKKYYKNLKKYIKVH